MPPAKPPRDNPPSATKVRRKAASAKATAARARAVAKDNSGLPDAKSRLRQSDMYMSRVVEDLIEVLIRQNVLNFTDLPKYAQKRLIHRSSLRRELPADGGTAAPSRKPIPPAPPEE